MTAFRVPFAGCVASVCAAYLTAQTPPAASEASFVGSAACRRCHAPIFDRWKQTRMANVVRDPREHPEAIAADFSRPNPLVTFTIDEIAFVYGSKFKQRYFGKSGDDMAKTPQVSFSACSMIRRCSRSGSLTTRLT